ncbi:hypothetical protein ID866_3621 [Astraeus odoratus]|nr:hypothetical protein ID866_3621 [Astraeus odoratus]
MKRAAIATYRRLYETNTSSYTSSSCVSILVVSQINIVNTLFQGGRPSVTSIGIHPAGHFFAVGYSDGFIGFWAVSDDHHPLLVSTIMGLDKQNSHSPLKPAGDDVQHPNLEAIYRLAWCGFPNSSDPRGGDTALLVLGGGLSSDDQCQGLAVLLMPAFNPASSPPGNSDSLHQSVRDAMIRTLVPKKTHLYTTSAVVRDFCTVPRSSPHFSGTWDVIAVICVCGTPRSTYLEAYKFPPRHFFDDGPGLPEQLSDSQEDTIVHLSALLEEIKADPDPEWLQLPSALGNGSDRIIAAHLMSINHETMDDLWHASTPANLLALHGGAAWIHDARLTQSKLAKFQPRRLLVTIHHDARVRFYDVSPELLLGREDSPMKMDFPHCLYHLVIDVSDVLADPQLYENTPPIRPEVQSIQLAQEALECLVAMTSGEILVYRFRLRDEEQHTLNVTDKEIVLLDPGLSREHRFRPYILLRRQPSNTTCYTLSDIDVLIGFLAAGYANGVVVVIDLRGPSVLRVPQLDHAGTVLPGFHRHRDSRPDGVVSLTWAVTGLSSDLQLAVRLVAVHKSGATYVYKLARTPGSLSHSFVQTATVQTLPNVLAHSSYVVDSRSGAPMYADRTSFTTALKGEAVAPNSCFWVTASAQGAQCNVDITGDRLGRTTWNERQEIVHTLVVERSGSQSFIALSSNGEAFVHALPYLEFLHSITLLATPHSPISVDRTGDFVYCEATSSPSAESRVILASLFSSGRVYDEPLTALIKHSTSIPPQPQPVSIGPPSFLNSWFNKSMTGEGLDTICEFV